MLLGSDGPLTAVLKAAVDAVVVIDDRGIILQVSDSVQRLFGYSADECLGQNVGLLMPEPDRSAHDGYIANYLAGGRAKIIGIGRKTLGRKNSGATFPMHLSVGEFEYNGKIYFLGICHDLTEYNETLNKLRDAERRYKGIVESQKHYICRLDDQLRITFANTSFVNVFGRPYEELLGMSLSSLIADNEKELVNTIGSLLSSPKVDEINIKVTMKSHNSEKLADWSFKKVEGEESFNDEIQGMGFDISEKEAALAKAAYLKDHDPLTGLLNGRALVEKFEAAEKQSSLYAVIYLDIDRFGQINQRYGFRNGDRAFIKIASRVNRALRGDSWLARPGGDELLAVCPVDGRADAESLVSSLLEIFSKPFELDGEELWMGAKMGVALYPSDETNFSQIPRFAEASLRDAKSRDECVVYFKESNHQKLLRRIVIEQALKTALHNNSIEIYLQPKVHLASLSVQSHEALARWHHHELGPISPSEFIEVAEVTGMASAFDRYILRKVAEIISGYSWAEDGCPAIAVNITAGHFSGVSIFDYVSDILKEFSIPPEAIELEITERVIVDTSSVALHNLQRLRNLGVKISIDDFGTGYSSLSYLKRLEVDEIKIDKSFIDDIADPKGEALVRAMIDIAQAYGLQVIAEGIETEAQAVLLTKMGCALGQGYYFDRPLPYREVLARKISD
ncbi:EAL domain-containing protein [Marinimicrobium sp. C2-29]|uniref:EAL domain-containing protein n=1 Tax=Marinimicrobium sp. C2-29 TaxID=3139825 RepID=UPI003139D022